jgi:hypothetical protein
MSFKQDRLRAEVASIRAKIARLQTALAVKEQSLQKHTCPNSRAADHGSY